MAKVKSVANDRYLIFCPACNCAHGVDASWSFNGDHEKPTFQPSILVNGNVRYINPAVPRCHSFVTDGKFIYLSDCTHYLAGHTVDLPDWD